MLNVPSGRTNLNTFFKLAFGPTSGYVCISLIKRGQERKAKFVTDKFFAWPDQASEMVDYVIAAAPDNNVYYCPQLFEDPNFLTPPDSKGRRHGPRVKENVKCCPSAWADLDECHPSDLLVEPTLTIQSGPNRYQALWCFAEPQEPEVAQQISQRIAYFHADQGADRSGHDLTQLLRVPYTVNYKYGEINFVVQLVNVNVNNAYYEPSAFNGYPEVTIRSGVGIPMPEEGEWPEEGPEELFEKYKRRMNPKAYGLYAFEPESESWSESLWKLLMYLFEAGMSREEVFVVADAAACNKFRRDGRPKEHLWNDVCRAYIRHQENINTVVVPELVHVDLLTEEEKQRAAERETFVERYIEWAKGLGDAAPQYHEGGAFVILSALLAGRVVLPTSFGTMIPNLWFMILGETTLTRKSTAMDIAIDLLEEVDPDALMATDGSIEGLLQGLSMRPGRPSIFLRDEFAGLLESMTKKDYMAGMAETLTKLYDGKTQKRMLRKEVVDVRDPVLILFTGGIKSRIQQLLTLDHVSSGFMPRFIYLTADSAQAKFRPTGPPVVRDLNGRERLLSELVDLHNHYKTEHRIVTDANGKKRLEPPKKWRAQMTDEAWERYAKFEWEMMQAGLNSDRPDVLTPVYDRLAKSTLKATVLLAASRQRGEEVVADEVDVLKAISFCVNWRNYVIDIINGVGATAAEREIERVHKSIVKNPGISRSQLMQKFHLTARSADQIFATLEQRGLITRNTFGRGATLYFPVQTERNS